MTKSHLCGLKLNESANLKRKTQIISDLIESRPLVKELEPGGNLRRSQTKAGESHLKCKRATSCPQLAEHNGSNPFTARVPSRETNTPVLISPHLSALSVFYNILFSASSNAIRRLWGLECGREDARRRKRLPC